MSDETWSVTTIGELITALSASADEMPDGRDTAFRIAICDGENVQFIDRVDAHQYTWFRKDGSAPPSQFVAIRAHRHPGDPPGMGGRGVAVDVDEELRELIDPDGE